VNKHAQSSVGMKYHSQTDNIVKNILFTQCVDVRLLNVNEWYLKVMIHRATF